MFPFPNNFWLRDNGSGEQRLAFGNNTFPKDKDGKPVRAEYGGWDTLDGERLLPVQSPFWGLWWA